MCIRDSNKEVSILGNHLKQGGLLILDNVISDYTFSIFLDKILPQSKTKSLSLDTLFSDNPFNINLDEVELDLEAIFINKKLSVLGIKKASLINYWQEENEEFFKNPCIAKNPIKIICSHKLIWETI